MPSVHRHRLDELRLHRLAAHLHRCGERAVAEFLLELAVAHDLEDDIAVRLSRWAALTPELLAATGDDRFPPRLAVVAGGRA